LPPPASTDTTSAHPRWLLIGLGLLLLTLLLVSALRQPPQPLPVSAPESEFSAMRARQIIERLLADQQSHAVGAPDHERMRRQVITEFDALGIPVETQEALSCSDVSPDELQCAVVRNLIAQLPGQSEGPALLLATHYDSAPAGPGAADDASGVAALLEIARAWQTSGPAHSPVIFLITDGEELGLLGARAFIQHPVSRKVGAVVNLEARGTRGQSLMFETSSDNAWLLEAYARAVRRPAASSLAYELYKLLPNDTDLSVFKEAGMPGLNFAFVANANAYHTPLDNLDNLDPGSLQHQGENTLAVGRSLASLDLASAPRSGDAAYVDLLSLWLVRWPAGWTIPLALLALILLAGATAWLIRRGEMCPAAPAWGALAGLLTVLLATLLAWGLTALLGLLAGNTLPWYAYPLTTRLAVWGAALFSSLLMAGFFARRAGTWGMGLGVWLAWALAGLILGLTLLGAATVFILPALVAAVLLGLAAILGSLDRPALQRLPLRELSICLAAVFAGIIWLGLALTFEEVVGFEMAAAAGLALGLLFSALLPLFALPPESGGMRRAMLLASAGLVIASAVAALFVPRFSLENPQPLSLVYAEDLDLGQAYISPRPGLGSLPPTLAAARDFQPQAVFPWSQRQRLNAAAPLSGLPAPELVVLSDEREGNQRLLTVGLHSPRAAREIDLYVPLANLAEIVVNDTVYPAPVPQSKEDYFYLYFMGLGEDGVVVTLRFNTLDPTTIYLGDISPGLPPFESDLLQARGSLAVPVDFGDITLLFKKVDL
jgi:hypothetical protein